MKLHMIKPRFSWPLPTPCAALFVRATLLILWLLAASCWTPTANAQLVHEIIGRLSGDDVSVAGAASLDNTNGRGSAVLISGSEVTVRTGQARILLSGG